MFSKLNIIIVLLFFVNISTIIAQRIQPLPLPQFTEAEPIWSFRPEWEDQIGRPLDTLEYTIIFTPFILQVDKDIVFGTRNYNSDTSYSLLMHDGVGVYSLDLKTGELNFKDIHTRSTGADDFITIRKENVSSQSGKLTLVGNRTIQYENANNHKLAYRRVYDLESGTLLSYDYDETGETIIEKKYGQNVGLYIPRPENDGYLSFYCKPIGWGESNQFKMEFQWISETMDSTSGVIKTLFHDTEIPAHSQRYFGSKYMVLNDSTALVLVPTRPQESTDKSTVDLVWIDISDLDDIHINRTKRIEDYAIYNDWSYEAMIFKEHNGDIYISDFYLDTTTWRRHTYLLHLNSEGEVVSYVKDIEVDGNIYGRINNILYIDEGNDKIYLEMLGSKTGLAGSDIISVSSSGDINFETSITTGHGWEDDFRAVEVGEGGMITDEGILVLPRTIWQTVEVFPGIEFDNTTKYIVAWDVRDFGMEWNPSATTVVEEPEVTIDVKLFPNPTAGQIEIDVSHSLSEELRIELYDIAGRKLEHITMVNEDSTVNFDLSPYASGSYFIQIYNEKGELLKKKKVIKL